MTHAEDLAYLREKIGSERFEDWIASIADEYRELDDEVSAGLPGNGRVEFGSSDVKGSKVLDVWRQPRPIRYRSKSA